MDVAGEAAEPAAAKPGPEDGAEPDQSHAGEDQEFAEVIHASEGPATMESFSKPSSMKVVSWMRARRA